MGWEPFWFSPSACAKRLALWVTFRYTNNQLGDVLLFPVVPLSLHGRGRITFLRNRSSRVAMLVCCLLQNSKVAPLRLRIFYVGWAFEKNSQMHLMKSTMFLESLRYIKFVSLEGDTGLLLFFSGKESKWEQVYKFTSWLEKGGRGNCFFCKSGSQGTPSEVEEQ